jgi:hypothetical protein
MAKNTKKILLVADYGNNDLAFKEVTQKLYELAQQAGQPVTVDIVSVDAFNTAQTAATVAQAAEDGRYDLIYHNTAPRKDIKKSRVNNDGEGIAFARYSNNGKHTDIVGVYSGDEDTINTFALLPASHIPDGIFKVKSDTQGSQFRSRDVFPPHVIDALTGNIRLEQNTITPPTPVNTQLIDSSTADAKQRLAKAYDIQLSRHGDASKNYVTVIAPKAECDNILQNVTAQYSGAEIDALPLKSQRNAWVEAAFAGTQLALNSTQGDARIVIILPDGQKLNEAEQAYEAALDNGAKIITSDVRALTFAKGRIDYSKSNVTALQVYATTLPSPVTPAYTDGYGNVKLALRHHEVLDTLGIGEGKATINAGERGVTEVTVGGNSSEAFVASGSFAVADGEIALSKGSSGWPVKKDGEANRDNFAEIFLRGGNASRALGTPQPGDDISITLKHIERERSPGSVVDGRSVEAEIKLGSKSKGA